MFHGIWVDFCLRKAKILLYTIFANHLRQQQLKYRRKTQKFADCISLLKSYPEISSDESLKTAQKSTNLCIRACELIEAQCFS
jgi:hypothetical protein